MSQPSGVDIRSVAFRGPKVANSIIISKVVPKCHYTDPGHCRLLEEQYKRRNKIALILSVLDISLTHRGSYTRAPQN